MYANDFFEIPQALKSNELLRTKVEELIKTRPMPGKALEGDNRVEKFKEILIEVIYSRISLENSYELVENNLPIAESPHSNNTRVFPSGWSERLVRIQLSRFYNQAVLEELQNNNIEVCFIPHSEKESADSKCTTELAGKQNNVSNLLNLLIDTYENGNFTTDAKIPNHPHCTHVIKPIQ